MAAPALVILAVAVIFLSGHVVYSLVVGRTIESAPAPFRAGACFMLGLGAVTLQMLFYSLAGLPFFLPYLAVPWLAGTALIYLYPKKRAPAPADVGDRAKVYPALKLACLLVIATQVAYAFAYATLLPVSGWDSIQTWFFKGHVFYVDGGVKSEFLRIRDIHADYPLLVPLSAAFIYSAAGKFSDQLARILYPVQFVSLILIFHHVARRATDASTGLVFTAMLATLPILMLHTAGVPVPLGGLSTGDFVGYADLAIAAYFVGAAGFLYLYATEEEPGYLALFALFAGLSAWTKDEGIPFVMVAVALGAVHILLEKKGGRSIVWLVVLAGACVLPWTIYKAVNAVPGEYSSGMYGSSAGSNIERLPQIIDWLGFIFLKKPSLYSLTWYIYILGLVANFRGLSRRPLAYLNILLLVELAAYVGVYVITHLDLEFHLGTSLDRLALHLSPLALLITAVNFHQVLGRLKKRAVHVH